MARGLLTNWYHSVSLEMEAGRPRVKRLGLEKLTEDYIAQRTMQGLFPSVDHDDSQLPAKTAEI